MAKSNHNKYVSYPDWFGSSATQSTQQQQVTQTTYYGGGSSSSSSGGAGLTSVVTQGSGNAVTSGTLDGTTLVLNKDLTFLTDQSENTSDLWELRYTEDGTAYLYANYDIVTLGGHTMYADQDTIDIPGLYDGLSIDWDTLYWVETDKGKVLKAKTVVNENGTSTVTKDWVLSIISSEGYINSQQLNDALSEYVTLQTAQTVTGIKNFENGFIINDVSITKDNRFEKTIIIDGNIVLSGALTMYADLNNINIPNLYDGLPIDNVTLYWEYTSNGKILKAKGGENTGGGGVADEIAWVNVYGKPKWIVDAADNKPLYSYNELQNLPDLSIYATTSALNNLQLTVANKADKATTLAGYGITDAYTKTQVDNTFKLYIPIAGYTQITGEKNFTGGLRVNNSPVIYYNEANKYWKLEGDLLITGGITQYGNDSSFVPSTIMDGIVTDEKTISKQNGYLEIIGDIGGGLSEVYWSDIKGTAPNISIFNNDAGYITSVATATTSTKGIASFNSSSFTVSSGAVDLKTKIVISSGTPSSFNSNTLYIIT